MTKQNSDDSADFADLVDRVRHGDNAAIETLWNRYYSRLVRAAAGKMPKSLRRTGDEEDVALSAFHSFVAGVRDDRFPDLQTPDNLWGLMMTLTSRKIHAHVRKATRQKRGGGRVRGESIFVTPSGDNSGPGLGGVGGGGPDLPADIQAELTEAADALMDRLDDDELKQIAWMRMDGYMVDEIAEHLGRSKRAVERRLQLIRKRWSEAEADDADDSDVRPPVGGAVGD